MIKNEVEKNITIIIPSKVFDGNLKNCIDKIRKFYKNIKIILVLDEYSKIKFGKNIKILTSGNKTIGFKRNLGAKHVKTNLICLIDSDAYPNSYWLNESLKILNNKKIAATGGPNLSPKTNDIEKILVARSRKYSVVTLNPKLKSHKTKKHYLKFLPSCNFIVKTSLYRKAKGMDQRFYSGEEISLNVNLDKLGYKMLFNPKISVFHMDRNFKHFSRQRFIYGSTGLWYSINYPCKESIMLLAGSFPLLFCLCFPVMFFNEALKLVYLTGIMSLFLLIIINSLKINYKNNFFKSLKLSIISFLMPGVGLIARIFLKDKTFKGLYTQR
jgi:GT2 family glycosyltransferase